MFLVLLQCVPIWPRCLWTLASLIMHSCTCSCLSNCRLLQINPHDAFGQQMLLNLESRGCALLGIEGERTAK